MHPNLEIIKDRPPQIPQDGHYFYVIQIPDCGQNRIKLGETANIYLRFAYYQAHLHGSKSRIAILVKIPRTKSR